MRVILVLAPENRNIIHLFIYFIQQNKDAKTSAILSDTFQKSECQKHSSCVYTLKPLKFNKTIRFHLSGNKKKRVLHSTRCTRCTRETYTLLTHITKVQNALNKMDVANPICGWIRRREINYVLIYWNGQKDIVASHTGDWLGYSIRSRYECAQRTQCDIEIKQTGHVCDHSLPFTKLILLALRFCFRVVVSKEGTSLVELHCSNARIVLYVK